MLINKWLITDTINLPHSPADNIGICLDLPVEPEEIGSLYKSAQSLSIGIPFTILLSGGNLKALPESDAFIMKLIGFFFLPSYRLVNYQPLVFLQERTQSTVKFLGRLNEKCRLQGIRNIVICDLTISLPDLRESFSYLVNDATINLADVIKKWVLGNINGTCPEEINILVPSGKTELVEYISRAEETIKDSETYRVAYLLHEQRMQMEMLKHDLHLKSMEERNALSYLDAQKLEREKQVRWYHYEYDILPKWYKQFGHVIKVIMGKRSFRSLFNDKIKKYND